MVLSFESTPRLPGRRGRGAPGNRGPREQSFPTVELNARPNVPQVVEHQHQASVLALERQFRGNTMYPRDLSELIFAIVLLLTPLIIGGAALMKYLGWLN
ncbi:hypothetical protein [Rhizobium sp. SYY.PMSO]|uniref:hypothetical protein n=1 Tax=Rhizobium sp. SYY.PMSO TaxID=3382192 RepID=UPI0013B025B0